VLRLRKPVDSAKRFSLPNRVETNAKVGRFFLKRFALELQYVKIINFVVMKKEEVIRIAH
jgi:hypothetical protein